MSEHSHAHSNELSKNNVKFLLVNATLMAFRYYSKELIEGFSSFGEKVKSKGDASHVLRESIINDGAFYPMGLYEVCLSGSGPGLKLIESKFKTNPVVLYSDAKDMACWNKARSIIMDNFPEAENIAWIRMIVDNDSDELSVKEPCGVLERLFSDVELLRRRSGDDSTLEFYTKATSIDMRYGINISICIFTDKSDGIIKGVLNTFYSGTDSFASSKQVSKGAMVFDVCHKILDDVELDKSDIEILSIFENDTVSALSL